MGTRGLCLRLCALFWIRKNAYSWIQDPDSIILEVTELQLALLCCFSPHHTILTFKNSYSVSWKLKDVNNIYYACPILARMQGGKAAQNLNLTLKRHSCVRVTGLPSLASSGEFRTGSPVPLTHEPLLMSPMILDLSFSVRIYNPYVSKNGDIRIVYPVLFYRWAVQKNTHMECFVVVLSALG